jgi:integration host factor subunit alpha
MGFSQRSAGEMVDAVFEALKKTMLHGEDVKIVQFGTFTVRKKTSRVGRNPRTGETMEISRRHMVSFRPSKVVRENLNKE